MSRPIYLSRDEAELLDDVLITYFEECEGAGDPRLRDLADELCRIWGMTPWDRRNKEQQ